MQSFNRYAPTINFNSLRFLHKVKRFENFLIEEKGVNNYTLHEPLDALQK